jgi:hypothetical protein
MSSRYPNSGESLADLYPEIARQANGWDASKFFAKSGRRQQWVCDRGHEYEATIDSRTRGRGCPFCSNTKVLPGFNDLKSCHPNLAKEADGWDPTVVAPSSAKHLLWKCALGHNWTASPNNRSKGQGCPYCAGRYAITGENDLLTLRPDLAAEANGWDPSLVKVYSHQKLSWLCNLGHVYDHVVSERSNGRGCPYCSGRTLLVGFNDLATLFPHVADEAHHWNPKETRATGKRNLEWICKSGHIWRATADNRTRNGSGCPVCFGRQVDTGINDLRTTHPDIANQAVGWDPTLVKAGSSKKLLWQCDEGHQWTTSVAVRTSSGGSGCPSCAKYGFKPEEPAWFYLVEDATRGVTQLGITNNPEERLSKHRRSGFDRVLDIRGPLDGYLARDIERTCLKSLERRGALLVKRVALPRFDGWTEAWVSDSISVTSISQILQMMYEDD